MGRHDNQITMDLLQKLPDVLRNIYRGKVFLDMSFVPPICKYECQISI